MSNFFFKPFLFYANIIPMETEILLGIIILSAVLVALITLVLWCKHIITHIDKAGHSTARETLTRMKNGR